MKEFEVLGEIRDIETIAVGRGHLYQSLSGSHLWQGRWRKMKGITTVRLADGAICKAEIHWFEAHGIGRKDFKIKKVIP